jgi:hypothetical protein
MSGKNHRRSVVTNRRGGVLALMAIALVLLLGMAALAVDLAMAFSVRAETQRVADAAALAGGSAFLDMTKDIAEPEARARAYEYALLQTVREAPVDSSEVTVQVIPDSMKVRVWINRRDIGTWFARILGIDEMDIGAMAAAQASPAGSGTCVKPFAVPDLWHETPGWADPPGDDLNNNGLWEEGEPWEYGDDFEDRYERFDVTNPLESATGYGSTERGDERDWGRQVIIKVSDPQSDFQQAPGIFYPFRLPIEEDEPMVGCDGGKPATGDSGGDVYRNNVCECNNHEVNLDQPYLVEPGDMIGPTFQGIRDLIAKDPDAYWDGEKVTRPGGYDSEDGWRNSPRVIKIALFSPDQIVKGGMQELTFNNLALMFLEEQANPRAPIVGRFLYFASGTGEGPTNGSLVLYLRLVE